MSIDPLQKRIGLSLVDEGAADLTSSEDDATPVTAPDQPIGSMADQLRDALGKK